MESFKAEPYLDIKCGLSEGPILEQDGKTLRFVDILNHLVYRVNLEEGPDSLKKQKYDQSISLTAELADAPDCFIFGGKLGIGIAKKESNEVKMIRSWWTEEELANGKEKYMRANDGAVDSKGRFWASALNDPLVKKFTPEGVLYRLELDGKFHTMATGLTIPNGLTWSKDNKTMYHTDTIEGHIYAYDFDVETGTMSNKRPFFKPPVGSPDGHAQDEHGNLWVACWGSWKVLKVSPEGKILGQIATPTRCPTAVAFAGEDVYITSEEEQEPDNYPENLKHAGSVFKCHVGVRGQPTNLAKIQV